MVFPCIGILKGAQGTRRQIKFQIASSEDLVSPFISATLSVLKILEGYESSGTDKPDLTMYPVDDAIRFS